MRRRALMLGSLGGALALTGCTSAPTHYYQLAPVPGRVAGGNGQHITVRNIGLPAALNQSNVPEPGGAYEADTFANDLWAGNLAGMLQTTMVQNLAQRLPGDVIISGNGAIGVAPDLYVEINVLDFSPTPSGTITLQAQLATRPATNQNWQLRNFTAQAPAGTTAATVAAAMSTLWGQVSDVVAAMVFGG